MSRLSVKEAVHGVAYRRIVRDRRFLDRGPEKTTTYESTFSRFAGLLADTSRDPTTVAIAWMLINVPIGSTIEVQERKSGSYRAAPSIAVPKSKVVCNPFVIRSNHTLKHNADAGVFIDCPWEPPKNARLIVDMAVAR